jgi:general secretion pathway protein E
VLETLQLAPVVTTELPQIDASPLLAPLLLTRIVEQKLVPPADLVRAQSAAEAADKRLDEALLDLGLMSEAALRTLLAGAFRIGDVADSDLPQEPVLPDMLRPDYLATAGLLPLSASAETLTLAMLDPLDDFAARAVSLKSRRTVIRRRIAPGLFAAALSRLYNRQTDAPETDDFAGVQARDGDIDTLRDAASDAPVIRFVQDAFRAAIEDGASDIHFRPGRSGASMHFRIDGELVTRSEPAAQLYPSIISRLKILANLDISEKRLPQDGRIRVNVAGRPVDVRVSTMPHVHGEAAVLRLLSRELSVSDLGGLGFSPDIESGLRDLFAAPDGLILVTGPTGSGKSTTLHAALKQLIRPELNVVTIEDPVEYRVDGAAQIQVDEKVGLTFPLVLRSLLRQDPDIILIGEIRDSETAKIAVQAALTGHLVLATLHTNSAPSAIPRLIDMGVEPYLLSAVLRGVLAQRLIRRPCPHCRDAEAAEGPCPKCGGTGYAGRVAVGELLRCTPELTEALSKTLEMTGEIRASLAAAGYRPLREDAERRAVTGELDWRDVQRLVDVD